MSWLLLLRVCLASVLFAVKELYLCAKDVAEAGGYGVVFGNTMTSEQKENFISLLKAEPRRFIAQEVIDFCEERGITYHIKEKTITG